MTNLIPGPNSTELAIHIGYERAGVWGLAIAGACFILPAMLIVWGLAVLYVHYQTLPEMGWLLYGVKPVIIAIVCQAVLKLGRTAIKDGVTTVAAVAVMVSFYLGVNEISLLLAAGIGVMLLRNLTPTAGTGATTALLLPGLLTQGGALPLEPITWGQVFWIFLKIGSVLYGGGYVLLAFLQRDLVERTHWLTSQQLLDAVAIGQITPGSCVHHRNLYWLYPGGEPWGDCGNSGDFSPRLCASGIGQSLGAQTTSFLLDGGLFRWGERCGSRTDGGCHLEVGAGGFGGCADFGHRCCQLGDGVWERRQFCLAGNSWGTHRLFSPSLTSQGNFSFTR